ncbi:hypothetical protein [Leptospira kanakyensis]|uniref:hypothetical protein n=1 Tax=Leptospira kanakyensis TaxID=2484968 RepID=UPI00223DC678|nr:hypothetical protein [Leptospira kanakyensis]MCW7471391.1 hypothetical protein [Leptospira kanakyensis]
MKIKSSRINIYETLGLLNFLKTFIFSNQVYYSNISFFTRLFLNIFKIDIRDSASILSYGAISSSNGIRKFSYQSAIQSLDELQVDRLNFGLWYAAGIRDGIIIRKFIFEYIFKKFEFYSIVNQFYKENQSEDIKLRIEHHLINEKSVFGKNVVYTRTLTFHRIDFFVSILFLPVFLLIFFLKNRSSKNVELSNSVVCEVDSVKIFEMFNDIFKEISNVNFFVQKTYRNFFDSSFFVNDKHFTHGLNIKNFYTFIRLIRSLFKYIYKNCFFVSRFGTSIFNLYKTIANGFLLTPSAMKSIYFTFEHMSTSKAVRNELLRASGNLSVFVPYNAYAIDHFFVPEFMYNYDILCSPGKLLEKVYFMQKALTKTILPTGSYHPNKKKQFSDGYIERIESLKKQKGNNIAITILSNGIQDETLIWEKKMMSLARELARIDKLTIFIRQKPVTPHRKYLDFFQQEKCEIESIILTHSEYELFDFLDVTDLFLTTSSSSAVDLCIAGGQFYSIDFTEEKDLYLWQTEVDGVYIGENLAKSRILQWITNHNNEQTLHKKRMDELKKILNYTFNDFEAYKANLLMQLNPYFVKIAND